MHRHNIVKLSIIRYWVTTYLFQVNYKHIAKGFLKNSDKEVEKYQVEKQLTSAADLFLSSSYFFLSFLGTIWNSAQLALSFLKLNLLTMKTTHHKKTTWQSYQIQEFILVLSQNQQLQWGNVF